MRDTAEWVYEEGREAYRRQAFLAWHQSNTLAGMFGGAEDLPGFGEFLDGLGLGEAPKKELEFETKDEAVNHVLAAFGAKPLDTEGPQGPEERLLNEG